MKYLEVKAMREHYQNKALTGDLSLHDELESLGHDPLDGVSFASPAASGLAHDEGLIVEDFLGVEPSSTYGYTKGDVETVLGRARG